MLCGVLLMQYLRVISQWHFRSCAAAAAAVAAVFICLLVNCLSHLPHVLVYRCRMISSMANNLNNSIVVDTVDRYTFVCEPLALSPESTRMVMQLCYYPRAHN